MYKDGLSIFKKMYLHQIKIF